MKATEYLAEAINTLGQRGKEHDTGGGEERSMARAVAIFNAATGNDISEHDGWMFMVSLKMARIHASPQKIDSYVDGAAYFALAGESVEPLVVLGQP